MNRPALLTRRWDHLCLHPPQQPEVPPRVNWVGRPSTAGPVGTPNRAPGRQAHADCRFQRHGTPTSAAVGATTAQRVPVPTVPPGHQGSQTHCIAAWLYLRGADDPQTWGLGEDRPSMADRGPFHCPGRSGVGVAWLGGCGSIGGPVQAGRLGGKDMELAVWRTGKGCASRWSWPHAIDFGPPHGHRQAALTRMQMTRGSSVVSLVLQHLRAPIPQAKDVQICLWCHGLVLRHRVNAICPEIACSRGD